MNVGSATSVLEVHALPIFRVKVCRSVFSKNTGGRLREIPVVILCYGSVYGAEKGHLNAFFLSHHPNRQQTNSPTNQPAQPKK
jgi:hypothetical protein